MIGRLGFALLLGFVMACIIFDAMEQVWVEWKRLFWGEFAMAVGEKIRLTFRRTIKQ
jgi:hypothetical protein